MPFTTNPAYDRLLSADRYYHAVFLVFGGLFTILLLALCGYSWVRFKRAQRRTFERRSYLGFGVVSLILSLFMIVTFWANVTSVVNPRKTLAGSPFSKSGTAWLRTGSPQYTPKLQHAIDDRLDWQRPKAVFCSVLLVVFVALSLYLWRTLIRRSTSGEAFRKLTRRLMLGAGVLSAACCVLLMLMVIGNAECAIVPLFPTVLNA